MIAQGDSAFICTSHALGAKPRVMKEGRVTYVDKKTKEEIVEESLTCPTCFQTVPITPDIRIILDEYKNGRSGEITTVSARTLFPNEGKESPSDDKQTSNTDDANANS